MMPTVSTSPSQARCATSLKSPLASCLTLRTWEVDPVQVGLHRLDRARCLCGIGRERPQAESQSVVRAVVERQHSAQILHRGHHPGPAEQVERRIVGMYAELDVVLLAGRDHRVQEVLVAAASSWVTPA